MAFGLSVFFVENGDAVVAVVVVGEAHAHDLDGGIFFDPRIDVLLQLASIFMGENFYHGEHILCEKIKRYYQSIERFA